MGDSLEDTLNEFERSLDVADSELFSPLANTSLTLGNSKWLVHVYCTDCSLEDPKWPLVLLFKTRRDLVYPLISESSLKKYIIACKNLAQWLGVRGYNLSMEGQGWFNSLRLRMYALVERIVG